MYQYYLSIGTPIAYDYNNIIKSIEYLKKYKMTKILHSEFYLSDCKFFKLNNEQDKFISVCTHLDSELNPFELVKKIKNLEKRIPKIYIDLIWIENIEISSNILKVPSYSLLETGYALVPLQEIAKTDSKLLKIIKEKIDLVKDGTTKISKFKLKRM